MVASKIDQRPKSSGEISGSHGTLDMDVADAICYRGPSDFCIFVIINHWTDLNEATCYSIGYFFSAVLLQFYITQWKYAAFKNYRYEYFIKINDE